MPVKKKPVPALLRPEKKRKGPRKVILSQHDRSAGQPLEVSQSTLKTWRRCRNKYYYAFVELIEPRKPRLPLIRGTMIGKCLDAIALARTTKGKTKSWQTALEPYEAEFGKLFAAEQEMYGDPIGEVKRIVSRYELIYANDGFTYQVGKDGLPYELKVEVDIAPGIVFTGHIDKMPMDKQGRIWDLDHKSHKRIPDADARYHDIQQVFYQWAAPLSGYPKLSGVVWDYIRTKPPTIPEWLKRGGLSQRQNMDTDFETYMAEVQRHNLDPADYAETLNRLKARGHIDFYQRVPLPSPNKELVKSIVQDATETAIEIKKLGGVSRTRSIDRTCNQCDYQAICSAELRGLDVEFIRKTEYQKQKDPRHIHIVEEE